MDEMNEIGFRDNTDVEVTESDECACCEDDGIPVAAMVAGGSALVGLGVGGTLFGMKVFAKVKLKRRAKELTKLQQAHPDMLVRWDESVQMFVLEQKPVEEKEQPKQEAPTTEKKDKDDAN